MAREDPYFRLRIPESLKASVETAAEANKRSMTAEIIARLERTFDDDALLADSDTERRIAAVENVLRQITATMELRKSVEEEEAAQIVENRKKR